MLKLSRPLITVCRGGRHAATAVAALAVPAAPAPPKE